MNAARTAIRNRPTTSNIADTAFAFDGTDCEIKGARIHGDSREGFKVSVTEGGVTITLETVDGGDLVANAVYHANLDARLSTWTKRRFAFVFGLAARRMVAA